MMQLEACKNHGLLQYQEPEKVEIEKVVCEKGIEYAPHGSLEKNELDRFQYSGSQI